MKNIPVKIYLQKALEKFRAIWGYLKDRKKTGAKTGICQLEGCQEKQTVDCFFVQPELDQKPDHKYCYAHAAEQGFCMKCGCQSSGTYGFDFTHPGFCTECHDQLLEEYDGDEDDPLKPYLFP
jgi:hypothetical protein